MMVELVVRSQFQDPVHPQTDSDSNLLFPHLIESDSCGQMYTAVLIFIHSYSVHDNVLAAELYKSGLCDVFTPFSHLAYS